MRSILDAGFVFWGLFLVFGFIVVAYWAWMVRVGSDSQPAPPPSPGTTPPEGQIPDTPPEGSDPEARSP